MRAGAGFPADPLDKALVGQDGWFLQQTKKQRVKVSWGRGQKLGWGGHSRSEPLTPAALPPPLAAPCQAADEAFSGPRCGGHCRRRFLQPHL